VELGLSKDLQDRPDIGSAERVALRAQARALDVAEQLRDPDLVSRASDVYLRVRQAAGLCAGAAPVVDSFSELMGQLGMPDPSVRHPAD
jgi:hypothetical protein